MKPIEARSGGAGRLHIADPSQQVGTAGNARRGVTAHRLGVGKDLSRAARWLGESTFPLEDDLDRVAIVVEDLESGRWGATLAELADAPMRPAGGSLVAETLAPVQAGGGSDVGGARTRRSTLIRVLPPRDRPATGRQRVQALVTNIAVQSVVFYLDGEEVEADHRPPFNTTLELGPEPKPRLVRAVARDRHGNELGADEIRINQPAGSFAITLTSVEPTSEAVELVAEVSVPVGGQLERVEFYYNEALSLRLDNPPFEARLSRVGSGSGAGDYVTVVAHLADGSRAEDVRLLRSPGAAVPDH